MTQDQVTHADLHNMWSRFESTDLHELWSRFQSLEERVERLESTVERLKEDNQSIKEENLSIKEENRSIKEKVERLEEEVHQEMKCITMVKTISAKLKNGVNSSNILQHLKEEANVDVVRQAIAEVVPSHTRKRRHPSLHKSIGASDKEAKRVAGR
jgi:predicted RNase H-like nuclease (RuvC/YqgF family)